MTIPPPHESRFAARVATAVVLVSASIPLAGCRTTLDMSAFEPDANLDELASTDDVQGPLERLVRGRQARGEYGDMHSLRPMEGLEELEAARKLYDAGEYRDAEKAFKKVAKEYEDSPVEEDALFYVAECRFQRRRLASAQDGYAELLEEYPSTRHLEASTKRLFEIGREWLGFPKMVEASEIQQVDFENPSHTPAPTDDRDLGWDPTRRVPILPNLWDRSRPVFDTKGRGLEALRSIWLNDPTGPLADDALMLTASHYLREGNFQEADHLFTVLREEYPKSPHLEKAFLLGGHTKLMSYGGADYDGRSLDEAEALKASTARLFPDNEMRDRIEGELRRIDEAQIERDWGMVEFYQRKGRDQAVAMYCREVIRKYPDSDHAERARAILAELDPEAVRLTVPARPPKEEGLLQRITRPLRLLPTPDDEDETEIEAPSDAEAPRELPPLDEPPRSLDPTPQADPGDVIEAGQPGRARL